MSFEYFTRETSSRRSIDTLSLAQQGQIILGNMKSMSSKIASNDSGKRELHPYVRPGICTMLIGITCFIASLMAYKMTSKYDQSLCEQVEVNRVSKKTF